MANRLPTLTDQGNNIFRDTDKRAQVQLAVSEDNLPTGISIESNTADIMSRRIIRFSINSATNYTREVPLLEGSMKLKFPVSNPNSTTEKVCHEPPITTNENEVAYNYNDLKDTILGILEVLNDEGLLFP